jgi:outer membrane protein OmpA-like peptidoglycan-associated protein
MGIFAARRIVRFWSLFISLAVASAVALGTSDVHAQQRTFYLDRLQMSGTPDDGLVAWRPYTHERTRIYVDGALGFTLNPLRGGPLTDNPNIERQLENPVREQTILYLLTGWEFSRFAVGLQIPLILLQGGGQDPQIHGIGNGLNRTSPVFEDIRISGKGRIYESDNKKFSFGAGAAFFVPTGNATAFASDEGASSFLFGNFEYNFGKFFLTGMLGPHIRPTHRIQGAAPGKLGVGSELRWVASIFLPLRDDKIRLGASLWGGFGLEDDIDDRSQFFNGRNTQLEWLAEARYFFNKEKTFFFSGGGGTRLSGGYGAPDLRLIASIGYWSTLTDFGPGQTRSVRRRHAPEVEMHDKDSDGDGYPDDIDLCPNEKEDGKPPRPDDGCPAPKDRDGDGIPDDMDKCPDQPEDKDGIQDADGCPEVDADSDGIPDKEDACPLLKGDKSPDPKKNGCKIRGSTVETESGVQLLEPIQFDTGKSTIKKVSFGMLDEVVEVLKSRPDAHMGIFGHTDSRGEREMNLKLSKDRAASVVRYLVTKGISGARLESDGYGPDKPIDTNETEEGRARNRRVEFKIQDEMKK